MKHKHAELIKAWADGAEIEFKTADGHWVELNKDTGIWLPHYEYRIKPEPNTQWIDEESTISMIGGIYPKKLKEYLDSLEKRIEELEKASEK